MSSLQRWLFVAIFAALLGLLDGDTEKSERILADLELQRQQEAERQERITSDLALAARVDLLHNILAEQAERP